MEGQIIRTCNLLGGAAVIALLTGGMPAEAKVRVAPNDPGLAYIQARAAAMDGDHARAAELLASLSQSQPTDNDLARKGVRPNFRLAPLVERGVAFHFGNMPSTRHRGASRDWPPKWTRAA